MLIIITTIVNITHTIIIIIINIIIIIITINVFIVITTIYSITDLGLMRCKLNICK